MEGTSPGAPSLPGNPVGGVDLHQEDANISSALPSDIGAQEPADSEGHTPTGANTGAQGHLRSRKRTKLGRYISDITLEEVQQYVHLPAHVACEKLGLGLTSFKRMCRSLGITTWPYRKDTLPLSTVQPEGGHGPEQPMGYNHNFSPQFPGYGPSLGAGQVLAPQSGLPATATNPHAMYPDQKNMADLISRIQSQSMPGLNGILWGSSSQMGMPQPAPLGEPSIAPTAPPPVEEESLLQRMCRDATPESLIALLEQVKAFSADMKEVLGMSIIDDDAVDLILYVCTRLRSEQQGQQAQQAQPAPLVQPPPPPQQQQQLPGGPPVNIVPAPPQNPMTFTTPDGDSAGNSNMSSAAAAILATLAHAFASEQRI